MTFPIESYKTLNIFVHFCIVDKFYYFDYQFFKSFYLLTFEVLRKRMFLKTYICRKEIDLNLQRLFPQPTPQQF